MSENKLADKIYKELDKRFVNIEKCKIEDKIVLNMKTGNIVTIERITTSGHGVGGHRYHSEHYKVTQTTGVRYFKNLYGLAKSMAYGYIK